METYKYAGGLCILLRRKGLYNYPRSKSLIMDFKAALGQVAKVLGNKKICLSKENPKERKNIMFLR